MNSAQIRALYFNKNKNWMPTKINDFTKLTTLSLCKNLTTIRSPTKCNLDEMQIQPILVLDSLITAEQ